MFVSDVCARSHIAGAPGRRRYAPAVVKTRLDALLVDRGLFESRSRAAAAVLAGSVRLGSDGARARKPGQMVGDDVDLAVDAPPPYVSRGGIKLANALDALGIDVNGRRALDVGASTGGFTDCLLQRGAEHVVALDVAYGELHWSLRTDDRVTVVERSTRGRSTPDALPYRPDLIVVDVSFISVSKVLPAVLGCAAERFDCLAMVKPQFEVGRERLGKGGVVRSTEHRREAVATVARLVAEDGWPVAGFASSGLPGPAGNRETFVWIGEPGRDGAAAEPRRGGRVSKPERITLFTHSLIDDTGPAVRQLLDRAVAAGVEVLVPVAEVEKHEIAEGEGLRLGCDPSEPTDVAVVLGGDGTILSALRATAETGAPVFAFNYGAIGFLSTIERDDLDDGIGRLLEGRYEVLGMPALSVQLDGESRIGRQRHLAAPPHQLARRRARLLGSRRPAREGALRRARRRHAGRVDGLQPRQRRSDPRVGRGGFRGLVHRPAHPDRAGARGRARRRPEGRRTCPRARPST